MRITPIVAHAAARIPQISDLFSEVVPVDIQATSGGTTDLVCTTPHGFATGSLAAVCIRGAGPQIVVASAVLQPDETLELTFATPHGLVNNSTQFGVDSWNAEIELVGFDDPVMNGTHPFVSKVSGTVCLIQPPEGATFGVSAAPAMLDIRTDYLNGWQPVTVIDAITLRRTTHEAIDHDLVATSATACLRTRVWGTSDFENVKQLYTQKDAPLKQAAMFINPLGVVAVSKDRHAKTSAVAELNAGVEMRQMVLDGFHVVVVIPTTETLGALQAIDLCHGQVLDTVLRSFNGFVHSQSDLADVRPFASMMTQHGGMTFERAFYAHEYKFESPFNLSNSNALKAFEQTSGAQLETTDPENVGPVQPVGTLPANSIDFDGIYNGELGQPLEASIKHED